jgi:hypothetical protein
MDFRELISENFKVEGKKLELMVEYAEFHADMEVRRAALSAGEESQTTLPHSLRVLYRLCLENKKVEISKSQPTVSIDARLEFDPHEMTNLEDYLCGMAVDMVADAINNKLEDAAGIRIGMLITSIATIAEGINMPKLVVISQHKMIQS